MHAAARKRSVGKRLARVGPLPIGAFIFRRVRIGGSAGAPSRNCSPAAVVCALLCCLIIATSLVSTARGAEADDGTFFREKIEPVLKAQCYSCHSAQAKKIQGGLRLDSRAAIERGGDSGPAVVKKKSRESLLIEAIRHEEGLAMPPGKPKLPDSTIADFETWIDAGAVDPRENDPAGENEIGAGRRHWAFQPVTKIEPPSVSAAAWCRSPLDAFLLAKLEGRNWRPAPPASRIDLVRRVTFDLTGLPPTPEEIDAFVNDPLPDSYPRLVDRLLNSRHYGERAATHWLDVVRFAESEGFEYDRTIPDAWRFRDYVIESMSADKPFDRFVTEQIAGDEIQPENPECQTASIFHRLGPVRRNAGNPDIALSRNEVLTERTDILGAAFLGLTVGCARCHDHKLEPISQKDYYRLQAYFAATEEHNIVLAGADEQRDWEARTRRAKDEIDALRAKAKGAEGSAKAKLEEQIEDLEDRLPGPLPTIPATRNVPASRTPIHVLRRGVWEQKGEPVGPRPLSVLVNDDLAELSAEVTNPRTQLAHWLTSPAHPLTSRVIVNRLWQQHFGMGLVKTANDFGVNGERPSHPELLDWLAAALVENGWRLKPIHRLIVLSNAYQQSSDAANATEQNQRDPENRLLWHFPRRRLSAEEIRDAMLAVSGRINHKAGGPSVIVPVDLELVNLLYKPSQWEVTKDAAEHDRRSIYLLAKRNLRLPFLETLDAPTLATSCARRLSTTHAPQALELLNGTLSNDLAGAFARRLEEESPGDREVLVDRAFRLALGRPPFPQERTRSLEFLQEQPLCEFTLALFNVNGFLYVR
jgi:hypothetical protein